MSTDTHAQKLFADGVHKLHYFTNRSWYQNCSECSGYFNAQTEIPTLLQCGHVCCEECLVQPTPCGCCNMKKIVKKTKYKMLFSENNSTISSSVFNKEEDLYDFHIFIKTSKSMDVRNQKANTTIQQILTQFDDFVDYQQKLKSRLGVVIKTKSYFYADIKKKTIADFPNLFYTTKNRQSNTIFVLDRLLGGIQ